MVVGAAVGLPKTMGVFVGEKVGIAWKIGSPLGDSVVDAFLEGSGVAPVGEDDGTGDNVASEMSMKDGTETEVMVLRTHLKSDKILLLVRSASREETEWLVELVVSTYEKVIDDENSSKCELVKAVYLITRGDIERKRDG